LQEIEKTTTSKFKSEKTVKTIESEAEQIKNPESNISKNQSQNPDIYEKMGSSLNLKTWTIVISYKSEEMKLLNEEFLALTNFQKSEVNFEFIFIKKEDENDSLNIEEILPRITTNVVVFKSEADIILLPNLVQKKPDLKEGIICINDDLMIKQKINQAEPDFVKFTFRGEILGPCCDQSLRQGPFLLSKPRFMENTITSTVLAPVIVRSKPVEFISAERILPQSYKITKPPPNFYKLDEKNWNIPPVILYHPKKLCEKNEIPIFIKKKVKKVDIKKENLSKNNIFRS